MKVNFLDIFCTYVKKDFDEDVKVFYLVRVTGVEPARDCSHKDLNLACMPISPHSLIYKHTCILSSFEY